MTETDLQAIPSDLEEAPTTDPISPPVDTRVQELPVNELTWENFEKLCLRIVRTEGEDQGSRRYGVRGQNQGGIDFYSRLRNGKYATYQCKKYAKVNPSDLVSAVSRFLEGSWAKKSDRFVFCMASSAESTNLSDEIIRQTDRLAELDDPIEFRVLDLIEISIRLKSHRDLVVDFFHTAWAESFIGPATSGITNEDLLLDRLFSKVQTSMMGPLVVIDDWAPAELQKEIRALARDCPQLVGPLFSEISDPPDPERVRGLVGSPPQWLQDSNELTWNLIALIAQAHGNWDVATDAWVQKAELLVSEAKASALARAAVASSIGGDLERSESLNDQARSIDPSNVLVALSEIDEWATGEEQLAALNGIEVPDDPEEKVLLAGHRALAHMLNADMQEANVDLGVLQSEKPDSSLTKGLEVTFAIQQGRIDFYAGRSLDLAEIERAADKALQTREQLIQEKRWSESTRLLMLPADAHALLGDRKRASETLTMAMAEEQASTDQKIVLGSCAAGRALDQALALKFIEGAEQVPEIRLIRYESDEATGTADERNRALDGLDKLVEEGGRTALEAATVRLAVTVGSRPTPWSESAANYLVDEGHERVAVIARTFFVLKTGTFADAKAVLEPSLPEIWALSTMVRIAMHPKATENEATEAAEDLLAVGPPHRLRVEAGEALRKGGNLPRAREVLAAVALDNGAPKSTRTDAFEELMVVSGTLQEDWRFATTMHVEWVNLDPTDERSNKWTPTISNRLRQLK